MICMQPQAKQLAKDTAVVIVIIMGLTFTVLFTVYYIGGVLSYFGDTRPPYWTRDLFILTNYTILIYTLSQTKRIWNYLFYKC